MHTPGASHTDFCEVLLKSCMPPSWYASPSPSTGGHTPDLYVNCSLFLCSVDSISNLFFAYVWHLFISGILLMYSVLLFCMTMILRFYSIELHSYHSIIFISVHL